MLSNILATRIRPAAVINISRGVIMKKSLMFVAICAIAAFLTGCAGVTTNNGGVATAGMGPNFYSEVSGNAMLNETPVAYSVVKKNVTATAKIMSYFTAVNIGDASYATLKAEALKQAPGADDLVGIKMDYKMKNICGVNEITVTMTATAVRTK